MLHYKRFAKAPVFSHNELLVTITLFSKTIKTAMWQVPRPLYECKADIPG